MNRIACLVVITLFAISPVQAGEAVAASISALIEKSSLYNHQEFTIEGEFIGEILLSGNDGCWLNISENGVPIGVFCNNPLKKYIEKLLGGNSSRTGNILKVSGTLQRICQLHGGELDFHAETIAVLKQSCQLHESISLFDYRALAWILIAAIMILVRSLTHRNTVSIE